MNAASPFLDILSERSDRLAIVEPGGRTITYGGLFERICALQALLRRRGRSGARGLRLEGCGGGPALETCVSKRSSSDALRRVGGEAAP